MQWKLSDDRPIYVQLMETITAAIASGTLAAISRTEGRRLPAAAFPRCGRWRHKPASIPIPCSARWQS